MVTKTSTVLETVFCIFFSHQQLNKQAVA